MLFLPLIVLVAGLLTVQSHPIERFKLSRFDGQFLYLTCLKYGMYCFLLSFVFIGVIQVIFGHITICLYEIRLNIIDIGEILFEKIFGPSKDNRLFSFILVLSILTIGSSKIFEYIFWKNLSRRFGNSDRDYLELCVTLELLDDSPIDSLLFELSIDDNKRFAMLSMEDRKVYVAKIVRSAEPSTDRFRKDQEIQIEPLMSGYRDKDSLKVVFTTYYDTTSALSLILRQDAIASVTEFNFDAYEKFIAGVEESAGNPPRVVQQESLQPDGS